jgi:hypothetical protein
MKGRQGFVSTALMIVVVAKGAQLPGTAELVATKFNETIRPQAPVAGEDILGVVIGPETLSADARSLYVRKPKHPLDSICVTVESRNGRYLAYDNTYRVPAGDPSAYVAIPIAQPQPFGTQYQQYYSSASAKDLAILAREGNCADRDTRMLPTAWGHAQESTPDLILTFAIQSGRSTIRMTAGEGGAKTGAQCSGIRDGQRTAFDTLCEIHVPNAYVGVLKVDIQRCSFDDCAEQAEESIDL